MTKCWHRTPGLFGPTCDMLAHDIWKLAVSRYPAVRGDAQHSLSTLLHVFKYSSRIFVPLIGRTLANPVSYHQYKGALHAVNLSKNATTMLEIQSLEVQQKLWIAVLNCYAAESNGVVSDNGDLNSTNDDDEDMDTNEDGVTSKVEDPQEFKKRKSILKMLTNLYARVTANCTTVSIYFKLSDEARHSAFQSLASQGTAMSAKEIDDVNRITECENNSRFELVSFYLLSFGK